MRSDDNIIDIERLVDEYSDSLYRFCYMYLKDIQLAEDALQETFLRAYRARHGFKAKSSVKTWLCAIAANVCKTELKRRKMFFLGDDNAVSDIGYSYEPYRGADVTNAVMSLDRKYREVIILFYYSDMSVKEIAKTLGTGVSTVTVRLKRARDILRKELKEWSYDE